MFNKSVPIKHLSRVWQGKRGEKTGGEERRECSCSATSGKGEDCPGMDVSAPHS